MIVSRRTTLFSLGTLTFLLVVLIETDLLQLPAQLPHFATKPHKYERPNRPDDGSFHWDTLPTHYPVTEYEPVPPPQGSSLPLVQFASSVSESMDTIEQRQRRSDVKATFVRCWNAYRERAWLADELAPISGGSKSTFGGWAATLVDTLDTLWIMDLKEEFAEAVDAALTIDFSAASFDEINLFETTIRYLGGLLAAYDLSNDYRLLDKSVELGDMLYVAFDTPNRMPITRWKVQAAAAGEEQVADTGVLLAEIGSLTLEFTRLSQITKDPKWFDAVDRIVTAFEAQQNFTNVPGMWPLGVNARELDFASGTVFTLGAMSDSMYEYLPKMIALLGGSGRYEKMYRLAMAAAEHSLFRPMLPDNADVLVAGQLHADNPNEFNVEPQGQHLVCFAGGMLALGGRLVNDESHVELGRKITDGCVWTYEHSALGIMPEVFTVVPCESRPCIWDEARWHNAVLAAAGEETSDATQVIKDRRLPPGFAAINDRRYILRPEAIESVFVLYRVTGDPVLQEKAWKMWQSIKKYTETDIANAAINDMTDPSAPKSDSMESFWLAETLKYFYLVFSEPGLISLDEFVLNTEAHPLRRP